MSQFKRMARPAMQDASVTPITPATADLTPIAVADAAPPKLPSKISQVINLLRRDQGALLTDIVNATGWQPHTARATLTGLKKKGHAIESRRADKQTTYFLA